MSIDGLVDGETASRLLGVSARRVSQLADSGTITRAARGLYDRISIERYLLTHQEAGERAWEASTSWAVVALLAGRRGVIDWLPERSIYRLEATLRTISVPKLVSKTRNRATVHTYAGHPSVAKIIRRDVAVRDWQMLGLAGTTDDGADGYLDAARLAWVVDRYALVASTSGNITLRATDFDIEKVHVLAKASDALVALDAASSIDPRTRGVAEVVLGRALTWVTERRGQGR